MENYFCANSVEEQVDYLTGKVKELKTTKLDKAAVVQVTGTGIDVVMSQKAVTDEINENLQNVNESLQTVNTELDGKLTKPTNPSAESAVTMLADGTVGTKLLSEMGGKLYRHQLKIGWSTGNFNIYEVSSNEKKTAATGLYFYINIYTKTSAPVTLDYFKGKNGYIYPVSIYGLVLTDGGYNYSGAGMMRVYIAGTALIFYIYGVIGPEHNEYTNYTLRLDFSGTSPTITDTVTEL